MLDPNGLRRANPLGLAPIEWPPWQLWCMDASSLLGRSTQHVDADVLGLQARGPDHHVLKSGATFPRTIQVINFDGFVSAHATHLTVIADMPFYNEGGHPSDEDLHLNACCVKQGNLAKPPIGHLGYPYIYTCIAGYIACCVHNCFVGYRVLQLVYHQHSITSPWDSLRPCINPHRVIINTSFPNELVWPNPQGNQGESSSLLQHCVGSTSSLGASSCVTRPRMFTHRNVCTHDTYSIDASKQYSISSPWDSLRFCINLHRVHTDTMLLNGVGWPNPRGNHGESSALLQHCVGSTSSFGVSSCMTLPRMFMHRNVCTHDTYSMNVCNANFLLERTLMGNHVGNGALLQHLLRISSNTCERISSKTLSPPSWLTQDYAITHNSCGTIVCTANYLLERTLMGNHGENGALLQRHSRTSYNTSATSFWMLCSWLLDMVTSSSRPGDVIVSGNQGQDLAINLVGHSHLFIHEGMKPAQRCGSTNMHHELSFNMPTLLMLALLLI